MTSCTLLVNSTSNPVKFPRVRDGRKPWSAVNEHIMELRNGRLDLLLDLELHMVSDLMLAKNERPVQLERAAENRKAGRNAVVTASDAV